MPFIYVTKLKVARHHFLYGVLVVLMVVLSLLQLILANRLATQGREVGKIEEQIRTLQEANQLLENRKASLVSLSRIANESQQLGFGKSSSLMYVTAQTPIAYK